MLSLDADQLSLVADDSKTVRWAFTIHNHDGADVTAPVIMDFSGIELRRNQAEGGIVAPSEVTFSISNANNTLSFLDLKGGTVLVELYLTSPTVAEHKIAGWLFKIKTCEPGYQKLRVVAEDFLQQYLRADYPKTRNVSDIYPSNRVYTRDDLCIPVTFGTAYIPLRDVYIVNSSVTNIVTASTTVSTMKGGRSGNCYFVSNANELEFPLLAVGSTITVSGFTQSALNTTWTVQSSNVGLITVEYSAAFVAEAAGDAITISIPGAKSGNGYIMLGPSTLTYNIIKLRSPRSLGTKVEYPSADFAVNLSTVDATWRVFQALIDDSNGDGQMDSPGFFGNGNPMLDPLVQFNNNTTSGIINPADVIAYVLEDMGVPSANIDDGGGSTFATAHATFDTLGLTFNGGYWYKQTAEKVLSQLLMMCHSCLDVGETVKLRVLSKTSQATIIPQDVLRTVDQGAGTFTYRDSVSTDNSDSCYVQWQQSGEAQDEFLKTLVSVWDTESKISQKTIDIPFVQDSEHIQILGRMAAQRIFGKEAELGFTSKGTLLALQPDDVITINSANYGGIYPSLIDSVKINKDCSIQFSCSKYEERLGSEIATGTLDSGCIYKITATQTNYFGTGKVVGDYFIATGFETCTSNNKVKKSEIFEDWADMNTFSIIAVATDLLAAALQPTITGSTTELSYNRDAVTPRVGLSTNIPDATKNKNELLWAVDTEALYIEKNGDMVQIGGDILSIQVFS
jgi:hypothetical protein